MLGAFEELGASYEIDGFFYVSVTYEQSVEVLEDMRVCGVRQDHLKDTGSKGGS